jgi:hypothetical protein
MDISPLPLLLSKGRNQKIFYFNFNQKALINLTIMQKILIYFFLIFQCTANAQNFSLNFDGTDDVVTLPKNNGILGNSFTIEGWFKTTSNVNPQSILIGYFDPQVANGSIGIEVQNSGILRFFYKPIIGTAEQMNSTITLNDNLWHHFAYVKESNFILKMYIDGVLNNTQNIISTNIDVPLFFDLGINRFASANNFRHFKGNIDDLKIWTVAKSSNEILTSYLSEHSGSEQFLFSNYKFDVPSDDIFDCSLPRNHGKRFGTAGVNFTTQFSTDVPQLTDVNCGIGFTCANNLLQNPSFESNLSNWEGVATIATTSNTGTKSAKICQNANLRQTLTATAGKNLTMFFNARSETGTGKVLAYIKYLSGSFQNLTTEFLDFPITQIYTQVNFSKTAPALTAYVEIGFVKQDAGCVFVDDICLSDNGVIGSNPNNCRKLEKTGVNLICTEQFSNGQFKTYSNIPNSTQIAVDVYDENGNFLSTSQIAAPIEYFISNNAIANNGVIVANLPSSLTSAYVIYAADKKTVGTLGWYLVAKSNNISDSVFVLEVNDNFSLISKKGYLPGANYTQYFRVLSTSFGYFLSLPNFTNSSGVGVNLNFIAFSNNNGVKSINVSTDNGKIRKLPCSNDLYRYSSSFGTFSSFQGDYTSETTSGFVDIEYTGLVGSNVVTKQSYQLNTRTVHIGPTPVTPVSHTVTYSFLTNRILSDRSLSVSNTDFIKTVNGVPNAPVQIPSFNIGGFAYENIDGSLVVWKQQSDSIFYYKHNCNITTNPCSPDVTAPVIANCPANVTVTAAVGAINAIAQWTAPTATDNCAGTPTLTSSQASGTNFPIGSTTVTYTAKDAANNTAICTFTVTVSAQNTNGGCAGNLLQNPGFESDLINWEGSGGQIATAPDVSAGSKSLKLCTTGNVARQTLSATAGKTYSLSWKIKTAGPNQNILIGLKYFSASYQVLADQYTSFDSPGSFSASTISKLAPVGTVRMEVAFYKQNGGCIYIDELCLIESGGGVNPCSPDITGPIIAGCPANISVTAAVGATSAIATWTAPTATDNCPGSVTLTSNSNSGTSFPIGSTTVTYTAKDVANITSICTFSITVTAAQPGCNPCTYCAAKGDFPWEEWLAGVKIGTVSKTSSKSQYSDFTATNFALVKNIATNVELTGGFSYVTAEMFYKVWIDYNHNGIFEEPSEVFIQKTVPAPANGTTANLTSVSATVPASALTGATRMRVSLKKGAYATPCETFARGEVEDFTVNIAQNLTAGVARAEEEKTFFQKMSFLGDYNLFPNPASDVVYIKMNTLISDDVTQSHPVTTIKLLNQLGKVEKVQEFSSINEDEIHEFSLQGISNGVYFMQIETAGKRAVVKKLVVSRMY